MKLGWIICPEQVPEELALIADTYLSVSAPVQFAAGRLLELTGPVRGQIRLRAARNLACAGTVLSDSALTVLAVEGGWTVPIQLPRVLSEEEWVTLALTEESVWLQPGYFYDFPAEAFVVASLITPPDLFEEGLTRLRRLVESRC
jgi:DNA-binding transcriptional MocR family regulator